MAKINYHKPSGESPKTTRIKSIVGEEYIKNYKKRFQKANEIARQQHQTMVEARDILIGETKQHDKTKNKDNL